eukprot:1382456-Amorphochlora_amoeboformis.AAC.1
MMQRSEIPRNLGRLREHREENNSDRKRIRARGLRRDCGDFEAEEGEGKRVIAAETDPRSIRFEG